MNKERAIEELRKNIRRAEEYIEFIPTIPVKCPLLFTFQGTYKNPHRVQATDSWWLRGEVRMVGLFFGINTPYNGLSLTINPLAISVGGLYKTHERPPRSYTFAYSDLKGFEVFPDKDLPLLLGWPVTTPLLTTCIKGIK